jgi:hypothetical protein
MAEKEKCFGCGKEVSKITSDLSLEHWFDVDEDSRVLVKGNFIADEEKQVGLCDNCLADFYEEYADIFLEAARAIREGGD